MRSFKIYKLFIVLLTALLALSSAYFGIALLGAWAENDRLAETEKALQAQIDALSNDKAQKEEYYFRLLHDDKFRERIIREKLGYAAPKEIVFRFDDSNTKAPEVSVVGEGGAQAEGAAQAQ